jgi:hypothetical protein
MLNSAISLLSQYIDKVTPYNVYSIQMERGENTEDLYYLCNIGGKKYVVFESDYISSAYQAKEAAKIFGVEPVCWLVKKDHLDKSGKTTIPIDAQIQEAQIQNLLVLRTTNSYLLHAVLACDGDKKRFSPDRYGFVHDR